MLNNIPLKYLKDESTCSIRKEDNEFLESNFKNKKVSLDLYFRASRDGW
jgi:hypothetical protein